MKDETFIAVTNSFQKNLNKSNNKADKVRVNKRSEFYNGSMKSWLEKSDTEMYSTHNEAKSDMTSVSKNVYIDKLDDKVNKYINIYYSTIKMKHVNVKPNTFTDSSKEINDKNSKFKTGDKVTISKFNNFFAKEYSPNWSEETFVI